jgi:hypothetical protein
LSSISFIIPQHGNIPVKRYLLSIIVISIIIISPSILNPCNRIFDFDISKNSDRAVLFYPSNGYEYKVNIIVNITNLDNVLLRLYYDVEDMRINEYFEIIGIYNYSINRFSRIAYQFTDKSDETGNTTLVAKGNIEFIECRRIAMINLINYSTLSVIAYFGILVIYNKYNKTSKWILLE